MPQATSRAVVLTEDGTPQLQSLTAPDTRPGDILLRTRVSGLCGTDLFKLSSGSRYAGLVLGHEIVGEIALSDHPNFPVGARLVAPHHRECGHCSLCQQGATTQCETFREQLLHPGGFSSLISVDRRAVEGTARVVPDHLADKDAVFLEPAACVLRGIRRAHLPTEPHVAILGAGSMGLLHALVLRAVQPDALIELIELDPERRKLAEKLLPSECNLTISPPDRDHQTDFDAVFDTVGGEVALAWATQNVARGGTIVLFAHADPDASPRVDLNRLFHREVNVVSTYSGSRSEQDTIWGLLCDGTLQPGALVTHHLRIEDFADGVSLARQRRALKVLFTFDSTEDDTAPGASKGRGETS